MKKNLYLIAVIFFIACSNPAGNAKSLQGNAGGADKGSTASTNNAPGDCGSMLLFREGAEITMSNYNVMGTVTSTSVSKVTKVSSEGGLTVAEVVMKNTDDKGGNEKTSTTIYKCDGKNFFVDMTSLLAANKMTSTNKTNSIEFPFNPAVGDVLADGEYTVSMARAGKEMTVTSHLRERKVEAKESVTTPAGTFECFRVSSVIETDMDMPGMDEKSKQLMEQVKKKMEKIRMIFWYSPGATIIKMENYIGEKLTVRSEVTNIKK